MRKPCEVSPLTLKTFIFFIVRKKGQNKRPVILTKIKTLLFVQEQSLNLLSWWRLSRPARLIGPHSSSNKSKNYILTLCPLSQLHHLSASQLHQDPKFISKAQTRRFS